jgi:hypothetical protein
MEEQGNHLYFEEAQHFPLWIKAIALLPVVVLGFPAILLWLEGSRFVLIALIFTALTLFFSSSSCAKLHHQTRYQARFESPSAKDLFP